MRIKRPPREATRVRRHDAPEPSSEAASHRMRATRGRDTAAELSLRRALFKRGLRFRVDYALPGLLRRRADIAFPRARVAVFVDGCFWHGCPRHGTRPKANAGFWHQKIEANRARDENTNARLRLIGWAVLRVWEHEVSDVVARTVESEVRRRRSET